MKQIFFLLLALGLFSCSRQNEKITVLQNRIDSLQNKLQWYQSSEHLSQALLWFQHSPEMHALYVQGYNTAKQALACNLKNKQYKEKKNAVVVDIDETILNNGLYDGWLYFSGKAYSDSSWNAWGQDAIAEPLPGTVDFLNFAKDLGCEVFYVSNRKQNPLFEPTLQNLKKFNLPFADEKHLLLKTDTDKTPAGKTTKEKRRLRIENELNYEILLLCGDQMADFDDAFDIISGGTEEQIKDSINTYKEKFGSRFIILPNPVYCDWLDQIVKGGDRNNSVAHLDSLRKAKVERWKN
ncbi:MAG: 5'-nucleotidase, lipoprotein e(P4) family [Bacteroidetes bacterium GWF2_42_66]|nr:MAG: 5'-nucleotidase, lipoprotein e(P4) family [Bacteroidetes bacterium GWA2_42_15]OFX98674.1 MAG: 5'-nucleotidase, lipoprotein e(P4) family [Bacteroidetes bacterium GWE2_42_39]OFY43128.1 MAG: 5'-nucleotidase, lipoprotein e(P4) family [Bacteroidetes bacterium GWF2_42_66]HBL77023.1 5'-nucleotidase, lipoprotein e(P4) family [Prolixibacteraceae bacterium]HCR90114.1 5'-nucleotidase, lipoprotein e(P4) family [Prolixibacteraceae bacterium]